MVVPAYGIIIQSTVPTTQKGAHFKITTQRRLLRTQILTEILQDFSNRSHPASTDLFR